MLLKYLAKLKILMRLIPEQWNFPKEALSPLYREEHFVCRKKNVFWLDVRKKDVESRQNYQERAGCLEFPKTQKQR